MTEETSGASPTIPAIDYANMPHIPGALRGDPASFPRNNTMDMEAFKAGLRRASASLNEVKEVQQSPELSEILSAAFKEANTLGALMNSRSLRESLSPTKDAEPISPVEVLARLKKEGLGHHANLFTDISTVPEYDARVADLKSEISNRQILQSGGGMLAEIAMGLLDPINLIPVGGVVAKANAGLKTAAKAGAVAGFGGAIATEAVMQQAQVTRSWEEGAINVAASTVFGVGLGMGAHGLAKMVGPKTAAKIQDGMDARLTDLQTGGRAVEADLRAAAELHNEVRPLPGKTLADGPAADRLKALDEEIKLRATGDETSTPEIDALMAERAQLLQSEQKRTSVGASGLTDEEILAAETLKTTDRIDARLAGIPMDKLLKNFGKVFQKIPLVGDAIAQGLRNPRLELQDARVNLAREVANTLDENPFILKSEAAGEVRTQRAFSEIYREIEGGHATAIKEIDDLWRKNKALYESRADFGRKVYFAAINDGLDPGRDHVVERAAKAYRDRVFDPVFKLFQDAGLMKEGVDLHGAKSYVPWVHRAEAIINDRDEFVRMHEQAFAEQLAQEFEQAKVRQSEHLLKTEGEAFKVETERNGQVAEIKKAYNGEGNEPGKIREAQLDKTRVLDDLKQQKKTALDRAKADRADAKAAGETDKAAERKHQAELRRIEGEFAVKEDRAKADADKAISDLRKQRDAEISTAIADAKAKLDEIRQPMSKVDREILKLSDPEKRQDRARQLALKYFDGATSDADEMMMGDQVRDALLPSVLKSRKSPILQAEAAARGWAETNIFDLGEAYHRSAGSAAAMANTFKKPARIRNPETGEMEDVLLPDVNLSHTLKEIGKRYDEKIQIAREHGGDGALEIELRQERDQMLRNIEILRDGALGRRQTFDSKALQRAGDLAMQFNSWRLMGGSVASSLADPVNIVIANGFADSWKYGVKAAFGNFKAALGKLSPEDEPAVFRHMRLMGAVVEREKNSMLGALMDLHNPGVAKSQGERFARNLSRQFWDWTGLTAWTQFWKNVSSLTVQARIIDMAERGHGNLLNSEKAWLANLRIDADVLGKIREQHLAQPEKYSAGIPFGDVTAWTDDLAKSRFSDAVSREAKNQIITPMAGDRLAFQAHPLGALAGQFRSYGFSASARLISRNAALANLDGGREMAGFYTGLFALGLLGIFVDGVKHTLGDLTLSGSSKKDPNKWAGEGWLQKWEKTPGEAAYNALDRTGIFLPLTEPSNILQKLGLPSIQGAMSMVAQDEKVLRSGSARYMHRTVAESIGGPTVGLIEDAAKFASFGTGFGRWMIGMNESFKPTSGDFARAQRFVPFGNALPVQQLINTGRQKLGTAFDWPRE